MTTPSRLGTSCRFGFTTGQRITLAALALGITILGALILNGA